MAKKHVLLAGVTGALALLGSSLGAAADVAPCVTAAVGTYEAAGFSCSVGNVIFSNITVTTSNASATSFTPFVQGGEFGLTLTFSANAHDGSNTDVAWQYNVTAAPGFLIDDAFALLNGSVSGTGNGAVLSETLTNPQNVIVATLALSLPGTPSQTVTFDPESSLFALKDQANFSSPGGFATTSQMVNAFSVTAVPGPIAGAGLPGLAAACGGLIALARRRRRQRT